MKHDGTAKRIAAFVAEHPGCTRAELLAGCRIQRNNDAMPAYCRKMGLIHPAGPRGSQRYYPRAEHAAAAHDAICAEVKARRRQKVVDGHLRQNLRRIAQRRANGARAIVSLRRFALDPGVAVAPNVRITIAPPPLERWACLPPPSPTPR